MKLAVMQPYFFPYIGYYQLVNYVDKFIFYDDVNYIKNGWINRNRILINNKVHYLTIPLKNQSSFSKIHEIDAIDVIRNLLKTLEYNYRKCPYFSEIFQLIRSILDKPSDKISEIAIESVKSVCDFLEFKTTFEKTSSAYSSSINLKGQNRLIDICKQNNAKSYINSIGGKELYSIDSFAENNISLSFINSNSIYYPQGDSTIFHPNLSIIDVLMHNGKSKTQDFLKQFHIE